jgi:hypothetical protein
MRLSAAADAPTAQSRPRKRSLARIGDTLCCYVARYNPA